MTVTEGCAGLIGQREGARNSPEDGTGLAEFCVAPQEVPCPASYKIATNQAPVVKGRG